MSEQSLADKIEANRPAQDKAQNEHNQQVEQTKQAEIAKQKQELEDYEKALSEYNKEQADYAIALKEFEKQQAQYEKDLAEYDKIIAVEKAKQAEIEAKKLELKQEKEQFLIDLEALSEKYLGIDGTITLYKAEVKKQQSAWDQAFWSPGGLRSQGMSYKQYKYKWNQIALNYKARIENEYLKKKQEAQIFSLAVNPDYKYIPQWAKNKALQDIYKNGIGAYDSTVASRASKYYIDFQAKTEQTIKASITTAKSNAVKEQTKWDFVALEFKEKKDSIAVLAKPSEVQELTKATNQKPQILPSSFFKNETQFAVTKPIQKPESILGITEAKSKQAVATYAQTQTQQRELFWKITQSKNSMEALGLKTRYQESNPYVGTPQTLLFKGGIISLEGVLIEKKLKNKIESFNPIASSKAKLKLSIPESISLKKPGKTLPTYALLDDDGNVIDKPTNADLYNLANFLIEQKAKTPTKSDMILSNYMKKNVIAIEQSKGSGKTKPLIDMKQDNFLSGLLGHSDEISAMGYNLMNPDSPKEVRPTLEALAVDDLVKQSEWALFKDDYSFYGKDPPKDSQALQTIKEKMRTPSGLEWLGGTIFGSIIIGVTTIFLPPIAIAKYGKYVVTPRNLKKAEQIAQEVYTTKSEKALAERLVSDPNKTEKLSKAIMKSNKEPVGIEMINPKTALISAGTETAEKQSPYIVVNFGRKGTSQIYQSVDNKIITPKQIFVKGKSGKEFTQGTKITKDITAYPLNKNNLKKVSSPEISNYLKPVGTITSVATKDLQKYPQTLVGGIEKGYIQTQKSIIVETEVRNVQKGFARDVQGLPKPDSILTKAKSSKTPEISKYLKEYSKPKNITTDIPKSSANITTKTQETKLKSIAREMAKAETGSDFVALSPKNVGITLGVQGSKSITNIKLNSGIKSAQGIALATKTPQQSKQELNIKQDQLLKEKDVIKHKQQTSQDQLPLSSLRYDLIVTNEQQTKQGLIPKYKIVLKEEYKTGLVPIVPPTTKTTIPPLLPGIYIPGIDSKIKKPGSNERGKLSKGFYAWNVDTERVGVYLPTRDLSVGKTYRVIEKLNILQRKTHTKSYAKRTIRKTEQSLYSYLRPFKPKGRNISNTPKTKIIQLSKPGKKKRKGILGEIKFF